VTTVGTAPDRLAPADRTASGKWRGLFPRMYAKWRDPWRRPYVLAAITVAYLLWSLLPVLIAALFSLNSGRSRSLWQSFSLR
jgi:hypothetical protein